MSNEDPSQFSLRESAVAMHEMFTSLVEAGFTETQALSIIIGHLPRGNTA